MWSVLLTILLNEALASARKPQPAILLVWAKSQCGVEIWAEETTVQIPTQPGSSLSDLELGI